MPMTMQELEDVRTDCMADDIDIPEEALSWIPSEAVKFFESGGTDYPRNRGLEGAETLAWYDLQQRQFETTDTDTMLDALAMALFKVTGDKEFETEAAKRGPLPEPVQIEPKEHVPQLKYPVKQFNEGVTDESGA